LTARSIRRVVIAGNPSCRAARPPSQFARPVWRCTRSGAAAPSAARTRHTLTGFHSVRAGIGRDSIPRLRASLSLRLPAGHSRTFSWPRRRSPSINRKTCTSPPEKPLSLVT
jgi:hypothetical protein